TLGFHQIDKRSPVRVRKTLQLENVLLLLPLRSHSDTDHVSRAQIANVELYATDLPALVVGAGGLAVRKDHEPIAQVGDIAQSGSPFHLVRPEVLTVCVEDERPDIDAAVRLRCITVKLGKQVLHQIGLAIS